MSEPLITRHGVVGLIFRGDKVLVIRRAACVVAPLKWCFPGGGIEPGETQEETLVREFQEELGVRVKPGRKVWECVTPWHVHLDWWTASVDDDATFCPNPAEVDAVAWMTLRELAGEPDLLVSNLPFLEGVFAGEILL